jgi:hypothetical protein
MQNELFFIYMYIMARTSNVLMRWSDVRYLTNTLNWIFKVLLTITIQWVKNRSTQTRYPDSKWTSLYCYSLMLNREAANTNFIVFGFTLSRDGTQSTACDTWGTQSTACDTWGTQSTACDTWGTQSTACDTWGTQSTACDTWGTQSTACDTWGEHVNHYTTGVICYRVRVMVFNDTFNNISVISRRTVLLVEETRVPGEKQWPATSIWQTLSHNVVSSTPRH